MERTVKTDEGTYTVSVTPTGTSWQAIIRKPNGKAFSRATAADLENLSLHYPANETQVALAEIIDEIQNPKPTVRRAKTFHKSWN